MDKTRSMRWAVFAAAIVLGLTHPAWAGSSNDTDDVTFAVGNSLSITDTMGNFTLTFANTTNGSDSDNKTVIYTVTANNMPNTALTGAVSAKINALVSGITLKANPGAYTNNGSAGNATLDTAVATYTDVTTTAVNLYNKPVTTGAQGKVLNGLVGINYKATATRDLAASDGGTVTLTVTLKDA